MTKWESVTLLLLDWYPIDFTAFVSFWDPILQIYGEKGTILDVFIITNVINFLEVSL